MSATSYVFKDVTPTFISTEQNKQTGYGSVYDEAAILQSLKNLFFISVGEVPGKPWLGNPLASVVFEPLDEFQKNTVKECFINVVERFEPRVEIKDLIIEIYPEYNRIEIEMIYVNLLTTSKELKSYRFDLSYNNITNIITRETK
jgi:phage baseplate assembly protein W